ncbi:MAG: hypothetical protein KatS3mg060_2904 [Dehalococcoidia bacterium]|nr:MAG: hypothetical protein KatS3mg060_2904 [Dehalococcoidia bacterium]
MNEPPRETHSPAEGNPAERGAAMIHEHGETHMVEQDDESELAGRGPRPLAPLPEAGTPNSGSDPTAMQPPQGTSTLRAPSRPNPFLTFLPPAIGCLAVLCVFLAGVIGIVWSGVAHSVVAAANGGIVVRVVKVARIGPDGQYHDDTANIFSADNRGMAGRVVYERVPRGYRGDVVVIWERLDPNGSASEIRKPDVIPITDTMHNTTWWYALRQPFPPGQYQFSLALAGPTGQLNRVGTVRFEVSAGPGGAPPTLAGTPSATAAPPGYRPPTRPPAQTPPSQATPVRYPTVAAPTPTGTPLAGTSTPTPRP